MSVIVSWIYMYVSVDYLHDVYLCIMVLHVCQCWWTPWCLSLCHGSTCMSVLITSMMSIIVSWFYMYVSVDYLHDFYHSILGLHVCQCWLPPWCLSLYHGSTCMSVLITSIMFIFVSWVYMYISVDYIHDVYHCIMGLHVCHCWLPPLCLSLYYVSTFMSVLITSMMSIIVSWFYMYVSVDYLHDVYHSIMVLHVCQRWLPPWFLSLYHGSTCMSVLLTSMMSIIVSWFYMYVSVDYFHGVFHSIMVIHVCKRWLPPWCLSLYYGFTSMSVLITSMMSIIVSWFYIYVSVHYLHDVYHYVIGLHVCQCCLLTCCIL